MPTVQYIYPHPTVPPTQSVLLKDVTLAGPPQVYDFILSMQLRSVDIAVTNQPVHSYVAVVIQSS